MTLERMVQTWQAADAAKRARALQVLAGGAPDGPRVIRFTEAARQLGITTRALAYGLKAADIHGVKMPGRQRAFGIRAADLDVLAGGL